MLKLETKLNKMEKKVPNPTGKGGFKDNPQNRSSGRWSKETSISYWYNYLLRISVKEFNKFVPETLAQKLAYNSLMEATNDLPYLKEVTDRTEGKATNTHEHTGKDGAPIIINAIPDGFDATNKKTV